MAEEAKMELLELVDDFYVYPLEKSSEWKWRHGDQLVNSWYAERGKNLRWDTVFILQWDMLVLAPLDKIFSTLNLGEIVLSGFRPLHEVEAWWPWGYGEHKQELNIFKNLLASNYSYREELYACLFIVVCLPKIYFEKNNLYGISEIGFLEYKIPTFAKIFNIPVCVDSTFDPWWAADPKTKDACWADKTLNAVGSSIPTCVILEEHSKSNGKKIFHPFYKKEPNWYHKMKYKFFSRTQY